MESHKSHVPNQQLVDYIPTYSKAISLHDQPTKRAPYRCRPPVLWTHGINQAGNTCSLRKKGTASTSRFDLSNGALEPDSFRVVDDIIYTYVHIFRIFYMDASFLNLTGAFLLQACIIAFMCMLVRNDMPIHYISHINIPSRPAGTGTRQGSMAGFCSACKCLTGKSASLDCAGIYHLLSTFFSGSQNMLQEILGYFWLQLWQLPTKEPKNMFVSTDRAMGEKAAMLAIDLCRTFIYVFAQIVLIVLAPEHVVVE